MALRQILWTQVQSLRSSKELHTFTQKVGDLDLLGDFAMGTFRPLVPKDLCQQVIDTYRPPVLPDQVYQLPAASFITSRYVWKGLSKDVTAWARACLHCKQA